MNGQLLNRKAVKKFIIDKAEALRPGRITQVSPSAVDNIEAHLRRIIIAQINTHTGGKTFLGIL